MNSSAPAPPPPDGAVPAYGAAAPVGGKEALRLALTPAPALPSPLQELDDARFARRGVRLVLKRDDLIHPAIPGNKWRKLAPNLCSALNFGADTLLTFGGAYSNHLRAAAAAGRMLRLATVGVVRGDELAQRPLNPSLARCAADGMRLHFVSRSAYRCRSSPEFLAQLRDELGLPGGGGTFVIPEGGSNSLAVRGCTDLGRELRGHADVAAVACGTGGTLAGLAAGLSSPQRALGVPVLRGDFLTGDVCELQRSTFGGIRGTWRTDGRFHFGGYARTTGELEDFAADFAARHGLPPLERIYVAKLLFALTALVEEGEFTSGSTVAAVVTAQG